MNKKFFISIGSLLASFLLVFFVVWPLISSTLALNKEVEKYQTELNDLEKLIAKTKTLSEEYQSLSSEINKFFLALPEKKEIPQLLIQFENLAVNNGLLFETVEFNSEEAEDLGAALTKPEEGSKKEGNLQVKGFSSSSVNLAISGSYQAFKNYLSDLEKNIRVMNVKTISFGAGEESETETLNFGIFNYQVSLDIYYSN